MSTRLAGGKSLIVMLAVVVLGNNGYGEEVCDAFRDGELFDGAPILWERETCLPALFDVTPGRVRFWRTSLGSFGYLHTAEIFQGDISIRLRGTMAGQGEFGVTVHSDRCLNTYVAGITWSRQLAIARYDNGDMTLLSPVITVHDVDPQKVFFLQLDVEGARLSVRVWRPCSDFPAVPSVQATDSTYREGFAGMFCSFPAIDGTQWAEIYEVSLSDTAIPPPPVETVFRRGDANTDNTIDISDAIFTLMYLFGERSGSTCLDAVDANDDGAVDLADCLYTLQRLFANGPAIPPPYPECDIDPTVDALGCAEYPYCE